MAEIRPWLAHYDPDVPPTLEPYPERTLLDYTSESARTHPDRPALLFKGHRVSYAELERDIGFEPAAEPRYPNRIRSAS